MHAAWQAGKAHSDFSLLPAPQDVLGKLSAAATGSMADVAALRGLVITTRVPELKGTLKNKAYIGVLYHVDTSPSPEEADFHFFFGEDDGDTFTRRLLGTHSDYMVLGRHTASADALTETIESVTVRRVTSRAVTGRPPRLAAAAADAKLIEMKEQRPPPRHTLQPLRPTATSAPHTTRPSCTTTNQTIAAPIAFDLGGCADEPPQPSAADEQVTSTPPASPPREVWQEARPGGVWYEQAAVVVVFGVEGLLQETRGPPPATIVAFGAEGVLQETRGPPPAEAVWDVPPSPPPLPSVRPPPELELLKVLKVENLPRRMGDRGPAVDHRLKTATLACNRPALGTLAIGLPTSWDAEPARMVLQCMLYWIDNVWDVRRKKETARDHLGKHLSLGPHRDVLDAFELPARSVHFQHMIGFKGDERGALFLAHVTTPADRLQLVCRPTWLAQAPRAYQAWVVLVARLLGYVTVGTAAAYLHPPPPPPVADYNVVLEERNGTQVEAAVEVHARGGITVAQFGDDVHWASNLAALPAKVGYVTVTERVVWDVGYRVADHKGTWMTEADAMSRCPSPYMLPALLEALRHFALPYVVLVACVKAANHMSALQLAGTDVFVARQRGELMPIVEAVLVEGMQARPHLLQKPQHFDAWEEAAKDIAELLAERDIGLSPASVADVREMLRAWARQHAANTHLRRPLNEIDSMTPTACLAFCVHSLLSLLLSRCGAWPTIVKGHALLDDPLMGPIVKAAHVLGEDAQRKAMGDEWYEAEILRDVDVDLSLHSEAAAARFIAKTAALASKTIYTDGKPSATTHPLTIAGGLASSGTTNVTVTGHIPADELPAFHALSEKARVTKLLKLPQKVITTADVGQKSAYVDEAYLRLRVDAMPRAGPMPVEAITQAMADGELPARANFEEYKFFTDTDFGHTAAATFGAGDDGREVTRAEMVAATNTPRSRMARSLLGKAAAPSANMPPSAEAQQQRVQQQEEEDGEDPTGAGSQTGYLPPKEFNARFEPPAPTKDWLALLHPDEKALQAARGICLAQLQENRVRTQKALSAAQESKAVVQSYIAEKLPAAASATEAAAASLAADTNGKAARSTKKKLAADKKRQDSTLEQLQGDERRLETIIASKERALARQAELIVHAATKLWPPPEGTADGDLLAGVGGYVGAQSAEAILEHLLAPYAVLRTRATQLRVQGAAGAHELARFIGAVSRWMGEGAAAVAHTPRMPNITTELDRRVGMVAGKEDGAIRKKLDEWEAATSADEALCRLGAFYTLEAMAALDSVSVLVHAPSEQWERDEDGNLSALEKHLLAEWGVQGLTHWHVRGYRANMPATMSASSAMARGCRVGKSLMRAGVVGNTLTTLRSFSGDKLTSGEQDLWPAIKAREQMSAHDAIVPVADRAGHPTAPIFAEPDKDVAKNGSTPDVMRALVGSQGPVGPFTGNGWKEKACGFLGKCMGAALDRAHADELAKRTSTEGGDHGIPPTDVAELAQVLVYPAGEKRTEFNTELQGCDALTIAAKLVGIKGAQLRGALQPAEERQMSNEIAGQLLQRLLNKASTSIGPWLKATTADLEAIGTAQQPSAEWRRPPFTAEKYTPAIPAALGRNGRLEIPQARRLVHGGAPVVRHFEFKARPGLDVD